MTPHDSREQSGGGVGGGGGALRIFGSGVYLSLLKLDFFPVSGKKLFGFPTLLSRPGL